MENPRDGVHGHACAPATLAAAAMTHRGATEHLWRNLDYTKENP